MNYLKVDGRKPTGNLGYGKKCKIDGRNTVYVVIGYGRDVDSRDIENEVNGNIISNIKYCDLIPLEVEGKRKARKRRCPSCGEMKNFTDFMCDKCRDRYKAVYQNHKGVVMVKSRKDSAYKGKPVNLKGMVFYDRNDVEKKYPFEVKGWSKVGDNYPYKSVELYCEALDMKVSKMYTRVRNLDICDNVMKKLYNK